MPLNFGFCSFQIHVYKKKEKGCQSQSPSITTVFFLKPICKKMQSNPELIDHLGLPMPIHFLKNNPNVLQGPPVIKFIHICMGKSLPESVWWKICWWKKVIDQTFFLSKIIKKQVFFWIKSIFLLNKHHLFD